MIKLAFLTRTSVLPGFVFPVYIEDLQAKRAFCLIFDDQRVLVKAPLTVWPKLLNQSMIVIDPATSANQFYLADQDATIMEQIMELGQMPHAFSTADGAIFYGYADWLKIQLAEYRVRPGVKLGAFIDHEICQFIGDVDLIKETTERAAAVLAEHSPSMAAKWKELELSRLK